MWALFQQIALVDTETGEFQEKRLGHREEAETFYRTLAGQKVRVGMEASGHARWFERLLAELQFELWIGDAAEIRTKRQHSYRKYKIPCSTTSERRHLGRNRPTNLHCSFAYSNLACFSMGMSGSGVYAPQASQSI
jgi:hypothetical protein